MAYPKTKIADSAGVRYDAKKNWGNRLCRQFPPDYQDLFANEGEKHTFLIIRIRLDGNFAFTGKPAYGCENFFIFEFADFLELFQSQHVTFV